MGDLFKRGLHGSEGLKKIILQVFFFFLFMSMTSVALEMRQRSDKTSQAWFFSSSIQNNKGGVGNLDIPVDLGKNKNPRNCNCQCPPPPKKTFSAIETKSSFCKMSIKVKSGLYNGLLSGLGLVNREESVCEVRVKDGVLNFSSVGTTFTQDLSKPYRQLHRQSILAFIGVIRMVQFRAGMVKQSPEDSSPKFRSKQESPSHCAYCEPSQPLPSSPIPSVWIMCTGHKSSTHFIRMNLLSLQNDISSVPEPLSWTFSYRCRKGN